MKAFDAALFVRMLQRTLREKAGAAPLASFLRSVRNRLGPEPESPLPSTLETRRCLARLGVLDDVRPGEKTEAAFDRFVRQAAATAGADLVTASLWLRLFAAGEYGVMAEPVCGETPCCAECPAREMCAFASGPPDALLPGESPADRLDSAGPAAMAPSELLSLVVGGGRREPEALAAARKLLGRFGSLRALAEASPKELADAGVALETARRVRASLGLVEKWTLERREPDKAFKCGADFFEHYGPLLRDHKKERFLTVLLDVHNRRIGEHVVSEGGLTQTPVHPREVFRPAIREAADAVAFVHNHPSGDPTPSEDDIDMTRRLKEAGELCGIRVIDHVIIGNNRFTSFLEEGLL
jgi:DNA repair protein RadC